MYPGSHHAGDGIGHVSIYVQLQLFRCRVSHSDRLRLPISSQPWQLTFRQMAFSAHPIHDLHAAHITTHVLKEPLLPGTGFVW